MEPLAAALLAVEHIAAEVLLAVVAAHTAAVGQAEGHIAAVVELADLDQTALPLHP